jgi:hypothetical protein
MIEMALTQALPPLEAFLAREKIAHEPRGGDCAVGADRGAFDG